MDAHQHTKIEMQTHRSKSTNNDKCDGEIEGENNEGLDIKYQRADLVENLATKANANASANDADLDLMRNEITSNNINKENKDNEKHLHNESDNIITKVNTGEMEGLDLQKNTGTESVFQN